jgi:hypothetical protein
MYIAYGKISDLIVALGSKALTPSLKAEVKICRRPSKNQHFIKMHSSMVTRFQMKLLL